MRGLTAVAVVIAFCLPGSSSSVQQPHDVTDVAVVTDTSDDADVVSPDTAGVDARSDVPMDISVDVPCDPACGDKVCGPSACPNVICGECYSGCVCSLEGTCDCCSDCVVADECGDTECGPSPCLDSDGVPIPCGTCDVDNVCNYWNHKCYPECIFPDGLPTTWGKVGVVNYLRIPATAEETAPCFDYTGDGLGDCGLTGLASQVNPSLADMMEKGVTAILFEFAAVEDFTAIDGFTLKGLQGAPVVAGALAGDMTVDQASYTEDSCLPFVFFEGSRITVGVLSAGPGSFRISVPLSADLILTVNLIDTQIKTGVLVADDTGVVAPDGVLSGVVTRADLTVIIDELQVECDKDPRPEGLTDICPYVSIARGAMGVLFDLHQDGKGGYLARDAENPGDAASICLHFTLAAAKIVGYTLQ